MFGIGLAVVEVCSGGGLFRSSRLAVADAPAIQLRIRFGPMTPVGARIEPRHPGRLCPRHPALLRRRPAHQRHVPPVPVMPTGQAFIAGLGATLIALALIAVLVVRHRRRSRALPTAS